MAFCSAEYYDTIASVQKSLHEREKRRHELEEELFAYSRSEERLAKLKLVKLQHCHRELCKREQRAKVRNLELIRSVESLESNVKEFTIDYSALHHLKGSNLQYSTSTPPSTGPSFQLAGDVAGGQAVLGRAPESDVPRARPPSLTGPLPNRLSTPRSQTDPWTDAPVYETGRLSALSDVLDSDDPADGADVTRTKHLTSAGRTFADHKHGPDRPASPGHPASPSGTSQESGASSHHGTVSGSSLQHQSPSPEARGPRRPTLGEGSGEQAGGGAEAEVPPKYPDLPEPGQKGSPSTLGSDVAVTHEPSLDTASNISVSLSDDFHETCGPGGGTPAPDRNGSSSTGQGPPEDPAQPGGPTAPNPQHRLSLEGFFYLLDSIEEHLPAPDTELYGSPAVSEQKLKDMISRIGSHGSLRSEELGVCGAVVLHQLASLARSTADACLLPGRLVNAHWATATDAAQIRSCLAGDGVLLWDRWLSHVLLLLRWEVLALERAVQLFTPLLVRDGASYTDEAQVLLKRLLTHAVEAGLSSESEESSSCSLPALPRDGPQIRPARPSEVPAMQGVQSGEEGSADQSPVESIPIRETKAYQLLKQSATQDKQWRSKQEDDESDVEPSGVSDIEKPKREGLVQDSRKDPKSNVQAFSAVQSKAFWGDSDDDTNSDIEMVLRPQPHNDDDFDDFYD